MIQFRELIGRLLHHEIEFVIVGGVAATLYGAQDPTRDLDVCIRLSPENWAKVAALLQGTNPRYAMTPDKRSFTPTADGLAQLKNLYALTDLGRIDFLGEVPPIGDIDAIRKNAATFEIDQRKVRVIQLDDLLRVKDLIRRPKDLEVAAELRALRNAKKNDSGP